MSLGIGEDLTASTTARILSVNRNTINRYFNEFSGGKSHVNGIECFWSFAKRRLAKFNGLARCTVPHCNRWDQI